MLAGQPWRREVSVLWEGQVSELCALCGHEFEEHYSQGDSSGKLVQGCEADTSTPCPAYNHRDPERCECDYVPCDCPGFEREPGTDPDITEIDMYDPEGR
ncbi:gp46 [Mycobacterium phage PLot]|uniref:Uncharacterized protein n=1 Tax=Mycobacterium phage PLot TaxID=373411 RepID=Q19YA3_9CAUD|nr:gp46 [Mycobacterium phage PLot]ABD58645.1 hypothetical protein PBI_PLOT_46 [Mycobacterium phage PLot]